MKDKDNQAPEAQDETKITPEAEQPQPAQQPEPQAGKTAQQAQPSAEEKEQAAEPSIEELKQKAKERDEFLERLQRTTADYINYQKRVAKEREALRQFAIQELVEALVPCLDNFEHAINAASNSSDQAFLQGITLVEQEFLRTLANFNVERMKTVGGKFDPNYHEAVLEEETDKVPHQTILEEFRPGYTLNGRVIRAAQVKVSRHPKP